MHFPTKRQSSGDNLTQMFSIILF